MKRLILLAAALLLAATGAAAQHIEGIGVFSDANGTDCTIVSTDLVELHVIHSGHDGASGSEFMLDVYPPAWVYLDET